MCRELVASFLMALPVFLGIFIDNLAVDAVAVVYVLMWIAGVAYCIDKFRKWKPTEKEKIEIAEALGDADSRRIWRRVFRNQFADIKEACVGRIHFIIFKSKHKKKLLIRDLKAFKEIEIELPDFKVETVLKAV